MAKTPIVESHWSQLIEGLEASPMEFYTAVEAAIEQRQVPDAKRSRVNYREGSLLSAKREYLRVRRRKLVFDVCGAPYGNGFFVSYWEGNFPSLDEMLREMPFVGEFVEILRPTTYYKVDTEIMFRTSIHQAVREVVDGMVQTQGLRALTDDEWKPIMRDFFRK